MERETVVVVTFPRAVATGKQKPKPSAFVQLAARLERIYPAAASVAARLMQDAIDRELRKKGGA